MEKRVVFRSRWLPYALVAPQLAITIVFFFWPAGQAAWQSMLAQDPFGIEVEFVGLEGWQRRLSEALEPAVGGYDWVLLDCPPSLGHLTVLALVAADGVLVPLQCEYFALEGVSELVSTVGRVASALNPALAISGILLTMYDDRMNLTKDVEREIREHFGPTALSTVVPRNVRLAEAPSHGLPILRYDIRSRGAEAYLELARELLGRAA